MKQFLPLAVVTTLVISASVPVRADLSQDIADLIVKYDGVRNDKTPIGVTDGNPLAATSFMAASSFENYGLHPRISAAPKSDSNTWLFDVSGGGGSFSTGPFDGYYATAELEGGVRFSDTVAFSMILPVEYRGTQRTETYIGGLEFGLPLTLVPNRGDGVSWVVTPSGMLTGIGFSHSLAQGGYLFGGGATSSLAWRSGPLTLLMANQATYAWGRPIGYDETFDLRQDISQVILKNGFGAAFAFGESISLDGSVSYSNLLNGAFIDNYWTGELGVTFLFNPDSGIRLAGKTDYADDFKSFGGDLEFFVSF